MAIVFVPFLVATIILIAIHRRARRRDDELPVVAAIGAWVILGIVTVEVAAIVVSVIPRGVRPGT